MASENDIEQVCGFTGISRQQAIILLNKFPEAEKAVNAYYDDPVGSLQEQSRGWDELPPYDNTEIPHGPKNLGDSMLAAAPSRPPSRINSERSLVDLTHEKAPTGNAQGLSKAQQEEHDFQRAISNSMNDMSGQQSGVTGIGQQFGPATRESYDKDSWSLVPTSAAREIENQPQPEDRQRKPGQPAFLRPSASKDRLSSLLTIFHSIPLARETLLLKELDTSRYGFDSQWWNGQTINVPKVMFNGDPRAWEDVLLEVQRIMAFLDSTKRGYGSSDALAGINQYQLHDADTDLTKFFDCWDQSTIILQNRVKASPIFSSTALKHVDGGFDRGAKKDFYCLEPPIVEDEKTMNDVLDRVIWNDDPECLETGFEDTFIARLGEIFTAQFSSKDTGGSGCGIKIPPSWYPDRYLNEFREEALDMRRRAQQCRRNADKIDQRVDQVLKHKLSNGKIVNARETILKALAAAESVGGNKTSNGLPEELVTTDESATEVSTAETSKCGAELRTVRERIDQRLEALNAEKQQTLAAYEDVMDELTNPSQRSTRRLTHRYTLRGVATLPHVTYFRQRRSSNEGDIAETSKDAWQWWRASFSREDGKLQQQEKTTDGESLRPDAGDSGLSASQLLAKAENDDVVGYTLREVTEADVLRAAEEESKAVLVVYASDAAVNFQGSVVNRHLQAFVDTDNEAFTTELRGGDVTGDIEMISNRSSTTLATGQYKAEGGDSDMEPLINIQTEGSLPGNAGSAYRRGGEDDETLPSPKRSKGSTGEQSMLPPSYDNASAAAQSFVNAVGGTEQGGSEHVEHAQ